MRLSAKQLDELRGKSPEGAYQYIRQFVREELGTVDKDELKEALEFAIRAGILDEDDLRKIDGER
jgi:hypothetical protein